MGINACVAVSLIMAHALKVRETRRAGPVVAAVDAAVGAELAGPTTFRITEDGVERIGTLTVRPVLGAQSLRLVARAGERAWLVLGRDRIEQLVVSADPGVGEIQRFAVLPPWSGRAGVYALETGPRATGPTPIESLAAPGR